MIGSGFPGHVTCGTVFEFWINCHVGSSPLGMLMILMVGLGNGWGINSATFT